MKYLLIDTTTSNVTVSIVEDNNLLYNYHNQILNDMSSKIMSIIDDGFKNLNFDLKNIDKIFIVNGPGSFTGIRVGVTIAKTIAWSLKKEIIPLSSLELMATTSSNKDYMIPMIDARRGNVFAGIYDKNLNCIKQDKLVNLEKFLIDLSDDYELISYDNINANIIQPNIDVLKIVEKHKNDIGINPHSINPNYLKLTEAEENKLKNDKAI